MLQRATAHSSTPVGSKCEQCHVVSCRRKMNTDLFLISRAQFTGNDVDDGESRDRRRAANQRCPCVGHLPARQSAAWRPAAALSRRRLTTSAMCLVAPVRRRRLASHLRSWATLSRHSAASAAASRPLSRYGCSRCASNHARRTITAPAGSGRERPPPLNNITAAPRNVRPSTPRTPE